MDQTDSAAHLEWRQLRESVAEWAHAVQQPREVRQRAKRLPQRLQHLRVLLLRLVRLAGFWSIRVCVHQLHSDRLDDGQLGSIA